MVKRGLGVVIDLDNWQSSLDGQIKRNYNIKNTQQGSEQKEMDCSSDLNVYFLNT